MKQFALSTFDNPFNPLEVDQFHDWFSFDVDHDYNSCAILNRTYEQLTSKLNYDLTSVEEDNMIEKAIDRIIELDFRNVYVKISKDLHIPTDDEVLD